MVGALLILVGALIVTQVVVGDAVARVRSYADPKAQPNNEGPAGVASAVTGGRKRREAFVGLLLSQKGDDYQFGGETSGELDPNGYDCSEFIQWAMVQLGHPGFPDGSAAQIAHARKISVARAIATRGAVLYRPGHIAVSLGNGRTIEARGEAYGVGSFSATKGRSWTRGGIFRELT